MREVIIRLVFNLPEWEDYEDVSNEILLDDSGIYDSLKNGVDVEIIPSEQEAKQNVD